jgi:hypothetical protein
MATTIASFLHGKLTHYYKQKKVRFFPVAVLAGLLGMLEVQLLV